MLSYHGDPAIKAKYLARVQLHRELDHLTQDVGWEVNGTTKGCAVGCTLEAYDHSRYPDELGLPVWLAYLEDSIFEGLPREQALKWPEQFLTAIPVGVDVEPVKHQLAIRRLTRLINQQTDSVVISAIRGLKACHAAALAGNECDWSSAKSAALSAESAAWSAAKSAAWSAAWSAESAAWSAAWQQEAGDLIELLLALGSEP